MTKKAKAKAKVTKLPPIITPEAMAAAHGLQQEPQQAQHVNNSVVESKFKQRYTAHAREAGIKGKAARRSNWDWLSQRIAEKCLDSKQKIDIGKFLEILDLNGIDHSKWNSRTVGWEGRLRMTGRVALQRVVADTGKLKLGKREIAVPPADFVAKYKSRDYTA